ncbi:hypothetical protein HYU72_01080 [Candidatus Berkelbacteria bacterium]|nr:hypothetical protein [Candidatus Berkelbacteria bacterium]
MSKGSGTEGKERRTEKSPDFFFYGFETLSLDRQGRITIPVAVRRELFPRSSEVLLIEMEKGWFLLFPPKGFPDIQKLLEKIPIYDPRRDLLSSKCQLLKLEAGGRMLFRNRLLRSGAEETDSVLMIGKGNHLALWHPKSWEQKSREIGERNVSPPAPTTFAGLLDELQLEDLFNELVRDKPSDSVGAVSHSTPLDKN